MKDIYYELETILQKARCHTECEAVREKIKLLISWKPKTDNEKIIKNFSYSLLKCYELTAHNLLIELEFMKKKLDKETTKND